MGFNKEYSILPELGSHVVLIDRIHICYHIKLLLMIQTINVNDTKLRHISSGHM